MIELALVDSGVDINAISYETWEILGKPTLKWSSITIDTMSGQTLTYFADWNAKKLMRVWCRRGCLSTVKKDYGFTSV